VPWFRLDDSFHSHPKVIAAGNEAVGLYVRCGTYAAQHSTDGFIPEQVALLYGTQKLADTLVRAKLWRRVRGGWRMPDYLDYNPSKEAVDKERKAAAERQKRRREGMLSRRDSAVTNAVSPPAPSRPVPGLNGSAGNQSADRNARARENPDLIDSIMKELLEATGRHVTPEWAAKVRAHILNGRQPSNPGAYIRQAIRSEPNPRLRFLEQG
jgi:hypothetical protein